MHKERHVSTVANSRAWMDPHIPDETRGGHRWNMKAFVGLKPLEARRPEEQSQAKTGPNCSN